MMHRLFLDMDGVLADFDTGYERQFGARPSKLADDADWQKVAETRDFYLNLPMMPGADALWTFAAPFQPIILTGVPSSVAEAPANKRAWVARVLGMGVEVKCCRSREKWRHAAPGDVLVDDWEKYRGLWEQAGGVWVTFRSAGQAIRDLRGLGFGG